MDGDMHAPHAVKRSRNNFLPIKLGKDLQSHSYWIRRNY